MDCFKIEKNSSLVRAFHAVPEAPAVDIYVDDKLRYSNLKFKEFSKYFNLEEGEYKIDVYIAGQKEKPVVSEILKLTNGNIFTVAATGYLEDLSLLVIPDYIEKIPLDKYSTFRFIHLSPEAPLLDIIVDEELLFKDIGFREGTNYADVNPEKYNIKIVTSEEGETILSFKIKLNTNRIYTIYAVSDDKKLNVIQSVDGNTYVCR